MLISSLTPLLSRYALSIDLSSGPDQMVTVVIMPRKAKGAAHNPDAAELQIISITASAEEIDAELARGEAGALGQLIVARKALGDQLAEQRQAAEAAKGKVKPATSKASSPSTAPAAKPAAAPEPAATAGPDEPASLW